MEVTIDKTELYSLIKKAVSEALHEETFEFFLKSIPTVSTGEMEDIQKQYGKPSEGKEVAYSETVEI